MDLYETFFRDFILEPRAVGPAPGFAPFFQTVNRRGIPMGSGGYPGSAVIVNEAGDPHLLHGDRAGFFYKRNLTPAQAPPSQGDPEHFPNVWTEAPFVGLDIAAVTVADVDTAADDEILVGHYGGLTVLDNQGNKIRTATDYRDVRKIAVGNVLGSSDAEIVYTAFDSKLVVTALDGTLIHEQDVGSLPDLIIDGSAPGSPAIIAASVRGHVYRLRFQPDATSPSGWKLVAKKISPYLGLAVRDIELWNGKIVAVGKFNPSGQLHVLDAATLTPLDAVPSFGFAARVEHVGNGVFWVGASGGVRSIDLSQSPPSAPTVISSAGERFARDPSGSHAVVFANDQSVVLVNGATGQEIDRMQATRSTTAVDFFLNDTVIPVEMEISLMTGEVGNLQIEMLNGEGNPLMVGTPPMPVASFAKPLKIPSVMRPRILRRWDAPRVADSYRAYPHAGGVAEFDPGVVSEAQLAVGWFFSYTNPDSLNEWAANDIPDSCAKRAWRKETGQTQMPPQGNPMGTNVTTSFPFYARTPHAGAIDYVAMAAGRLPGPGSTPGPPVIFISGPAGKLGRFVRTSGTPDQRGGLGGLTTAMDVASDPMTGAAEFLYVGSIFGDQNGDTLHVIDATDSSMPSLSFVDAGCPVGIAASPYDLDGNPITRELVVGCANGDLIVYSHDLLGQNLQVVHKENLGTLMVGARNSLKVYMHDNDVHVFVTVDGGFRVLSLLP